MISVIIPLYNKAHTIKRTLSSVVNQSYQNFEIIIINDGSTDNSIQVINDNFDDNRVKIINQQNKGVSVARNTGVANSSYEHIAFLDGDDDWSKDYLKQIVDIIQKEPYYAMICTAGYIKNSKTGKQILRADKALLNQIRPINFFKNPHVYCHTSASVVNKKIFLKTNGFPVEMKKNEDYALFFSIALLGKTIYCGYPISYYYAEIDGQSTKVNRKNQHESEKDVCERINQTFRLWDSTGRKNILFQVFLKYELRHTFLFYLNKKEYDLINLYMHSLDNKILDLFSNLELLVYKQEFLNRLAKLIILVTKFRWRLRNFPRIAYSMN